MIISVVVSGGKLVSYETVQLPSHNWEISMLARSLPMHFLSSQSGC